MKTAEMISYAHVMASYNRWMNMRVYEATARLPDAVRKQGLGAFFGSIHGTLNHLLLADRIWMGRFTSAPYVFSTLRDELYADFQELKQAREREDARIDEWIGTLTLEHLNEELRYVSTVNPQPRRYPLWFAVVHFFNHQTHHRGQVTTLLSQQGVDVGLTDLIGLPELQP